MSICLDFDEFLLLLEYSTAELLSQYNLSGNLIVSIIRNHVTKVLSHIPWFDASKHVMNSAAMVEEAIMDYFVLLQEIAPPAKMGS
jgi:hypothetical protein